MFFSGLTCFILIASALATPLERAEGITIEVVPAAASVDNIDNLKFTATIKNNGAETVKILKYGTILDEKLPTKSFVVKKDGETVPFTGVKLSVSLDHAHGAAYTVINPGQIISVSHEVANLYDFASTGAGKYSFEPITKFVFASNNTQTSTAKSLVKAQAISNAVEVEITGGLQKRGLQELEGRGTPVCSSSSRKSFISSSYTEAKSLANTAISYINSRGTSDSLYRAYWGSTPTSTVKGILSGVANENSSSRTLSCNDDLDACSDGVIAYTSTRTTNVYFCSIFFQEVATSSLCSGTSVASRNIRGGTTLHELTHATGGTDDVTYGCSDDQRLSDAQSAINADSYNCFVTQVYKNTQC